MRGDNSGRGKGGEGRSQVAVDARHGLRVIINKSELNFVKISHLSYVLGGVVVEAERLGRARKGGVEAGEGGVGVPCFRQSSEPSIHYLFTTAKGIPASGLKRQFLRRLKVPIFSLGRRGRPQVCEKPVLNQRGRRSRRKGRLKSDHIYNPPIFVPFTSGRLFQFR